MIGKNTFGIVIVCALLAAVAGGREAVAQVVYNDGNTHTIPDDPAFTNGQSISLSNSSGLIVNTGAAVDGGDASSNQSSTGGPGITATAGTSISQNGGTVTGGTASTSADSLSVSPVSATGDAGVSTGGSYAGTGGSITGGIATATGLDGFIYRVAQVNAIGGAGLSLGAGATATLGGVTVTGGDASAADGSTEAFGLGGAGLRLNGAGPVVISSGTFNGGTGSGNTTFVIGDVAAAKGQGGAAIDVVGTSTLTINGGSFTGGIGDAQNNFDDHPATAIGGAGLKITGPGNVTVNAGTFAVGSAAAGTNPPAAPVTISEGAITVVGDASAANLQLTINGGTFSGSSGLQTLGTSPNSANARIDIYGGNLVGNFDDDLSLANPDILTTIFGSDFLLNGNPIGYGPVTATSGTLEGTLADNSEFSWTFERLNDAPLTLAAIPEPTCLSLVGTAALLLLRRTRARY